MMMSLFPVAVMKMSQVERTSSFRTTGIPSMQACRAQIGSTSATFTRHPADFKANAHPFPTSPYPKTRASLPASMTSVARIKPSGRECLHPYKLSNFDFVTASLTLMAGKRSLFCCAIAYNRWTPVVVSSETPTTFPAIVVHFFGFFCSSCLITLYTSFISGLSVESGSGMEPSTANWLPTQHLRGSTELHHHRHLR